MRQLAQVDKEINAEALRLVDLARSIEKSRAELGAARNGRIAVPDRLNDDDLTELRRVLDEAASETDVSGGTNQLPGPDFVEALGGGVTESQLAQILDGRRRFEHLFDADADGAPLGIEMGADGQTLIDIDQLPIERYHHEVVVRLKNGGR
jgi:hypothetical protein